jgi:hypothetical protein
MVRPQRFFQDGEGTLKQRFGLSVACLALIEPARMLRNIAWAVFSSRFLLPLREDFWFRATAMALLLVGIAVKPSFKIGIA